MSETSEVVEVPKRYKLSNQEFAKERITVIKEEVRALRASHPEVLSFCMFGSMATGTVKPESDIDGYLFVDAAKAAAARNLNPAAIVETQKSEETGTPTTYFTEAVAAEYLLPLKEALKAKLSLSDEQVRHIRSRPISREIIDQQIESCLEQMRELERYKLAIAEFELNDPFDKPGYTEEEIQAYWASRPKHPPLPDVGTNLSAMFHLDIGGGIGEYRQYLLERLEQMGEIGERVWQVVIEDTEQMEQHLRTGTEVIYPRTLEQAKQVYGTSTAQLNASRGVGNE